MCWINIIFRVWMGFSVKWYLPIIFIVLSFLFGCLLFPEKIMLSVWRVFVNCSWIDQGKSLKKSSKRLWQSPDIYRLRQSCAIFGNLLKLSGIVGKWPFRSRFYFFLKKILFQWNLLLLAWFDLSAWTFVLNFHEITVIFISREFLSYFLVFSAELIQLVVL